MPPNQAAAAAPAYDASALTKYLLLPLAPVCTVILNVIASTDVAAVPPAGNVTCVVPELDMRFKVFVPVIDAS